MSNGNGLFDSSKAVGEEMKHVSLSLQFTSETQQTIGVEGGGGRETTAPPWIRETVKIQILWVGIFGLRKIQRILYFKTYKE